VGTAELQAEWAEHRVQIADDYREWDEHREAASGEHLTALNDFLVGDLDLGGFRSRIDSLTKSYPLWGFRGMSQMFFNQLVKAAEPEALDSALKAGLPAPADDAEAESKLEAFVAAVEAARENAESIGATQPGAGRVDAFVTFFWELQDRESWPIFFPNSRDVLEQHGLLDAAQPQPQLYMAYRARIMELKELLGVGTWDVEHLLWHLGKGGTETETAAEAGTEVAAHEPPAGDLYASYRQQGLYFPDEVVTSLALSLATKRFVILSGISGTGKTKIALGLAEYLEQVGTEPTEEREPPTHDAGNIYIRLTAPKLKRGFASLTAEVRGIIDEALGLPERGSSRLFETRLPDGSRHQMRLNNIGFASSARELYRLYFRKDIAEWVNANAKAGDFLHLELKPEHGVDFGLEIVGGSTGSTEDSTGRHATIAVRSDWTDPRGLVGYFNPITSSYVRTELVEILLRAGDDPSRPYIVILDEMNLARVEYYFSDFLSALESGEPLSLMSPGAADENAANQESAEIELPADLEIPANVSFIGTVNIDETTHPFSPKVLDRANVIEFSEVDVERALGHGDESPDAGLRLSAATLDPGWLCADKTASLSAKVDAHESEAFTGALEDVHGILALSNLHFGYRVIDEISAFVGHALDKTDGDATEVTRVAFDLQLRQKVIPKLSGGRELEEPLARLLHYCLDAERKGGIEVEAVRAAARVRLDSSAPSPPVYPGSARKLLRMLDRVGEAGFVGALE
jgi:hypothetical protein